MFSTHLYWKLLAHLHVLVLCLTCVCICCASYLLFFRNQVYACWVAHHVFVFVLEPLCILLYLIWLLWAINGLSHFGGVIFLWEFHDPNNVCTWGISLRIDIARLSSLYVVCHLHEKFKFQCPLISLVGSYLPLVKINSLSHYGGVISFVHITSLENVNIWGCVT